MWEKMAKTDENSIEKWFDLKIIVWIWLGNDLGGKKEQKDQKVGKWEGVVELERVIVL